MNLSAREHSISKIVMSLMLIFFFEINYLYLAKIISAGQAYNGEIFLDKLIPQVPFFIIFYMAGYLFVLAPSFLLKTKREFRSAYISFFLVLAFSFAIFYLFPVYMNKQLAKGESFFSHLTRVQQKIDTSVNNFPSLHVSLNVLAALIGISCLKRFRYLSGAAGLMIAISTLLVKQHLLIDFLGGLIVAFSGFALFKYLQKTVAWKIHIFYYSVLIINTIYFLLMKDHFLQSMRVIIKFLSKF